MTGGRSRLLFVVNADWFFVSHRLPLARACLQAGYEVGLCAGESDCRERLESEGIRFFGLPIDRGGTNPLRDSKTLLSLIGTYRAFRPDIVHHVTIKPVLYGSLAARAVGIKSVVNAVSGLGYAFIPRQQERPHHAALRSALRAAYRVALTGRRTRVIFQNEDDRQTFVQEGLVDGARTRLVRGSGVDLELFRSCPLPESEFLALVPSRLLWDKGIGELVAAARILKQTYPRARFVLLGRIDPGNPAAIAESQVEAWVREGVIEWWPACSHERMPEQYRAAHVVVLPSYREGLPLALAEAAATGRAVITTDVPGCRDTVIAGRTGWLVRPRDSETLLLALKEAIDDPDGLAQRGERGRELASERFGLPDVIAKTQACYAELTSMSNS
jgi:glycosyltransferase involved in cell wall biosynthesis